MFKFYKLTLCKMTILYFIELFLYIIYTIDIEYLYIIKNYLFAYDLYFIANILTME